MKIVPLDSIPAQPWKNGGGRTHELLAWPMAADWRLRVSVADILGDGPFSPYPGVERWFAVLQGAGVQLAWPGGGERRLTPRDAALHFPGDPAPQCRLVGGPTRDLNLMLRGSGEAGLSPVLSGAGWATTAAQCGLFTLCEGTWESAEGRKRVLPAWSLCWLPRAPRHMQRFTARDDSVQPAGWWLHATPQAVDTPQAGHA